MDTSPITFNRTEILYECIMCTHSVCTPVPHSSMLRLPVTSFVAFFCPYVILYFSFIVCYRVFDQSICCSLSLSTCCNTSTKTMFKTFFFVLKKQQQKIVFFSKKFILAYNFVPLVFLSVYRSHVILVTLSLTINPLYSDFFVRFCYYNRQLMRLPFVKSNHRGQR